MIDRDKFYFRTFCVLFWVAATFGFVSQEILPFLEAAWRPLSLVLDVGMLILGLKTLRGKYLTWLIAIFFGIAFLSSRINGMTLVQTLNGIREFFPMIWPYVIVLYLFKSKQAERFRDSFDKQMKVFLILQAICITEQFLRYGANDFGGGSMGKGYSGQASLLIISLVFYFVTKDWDADNYLKSLWENRGYFLLLYPIFLNETKVSFIALAMMFLLLYKFEFKSIWKIIITLPVFALLGYGLFQVYLWATGGDDEIGTSNYIVDYLSGTDDFTPEELIDIIEIVAVEGEHEEMETFQMGEFDMPRIMRIALVPTVLEQTPGGLVLGAGLGHFKGGTTLERTQLAQDNIFMFNGTMTTFLMIFISMGVLGILWYFFWTKYAIKWKTREGTMALQWKIYLTAMVVLIFFYNDSFRFYPFPVIFYILCCLRTYPAVAETESQN